MVPTSLQRECSLTVCLNHLLCYLSSTDLDSNPVCPLSLSANSSSGSLACPLRPDYGETQLAPVELCSSLFCHR